METTTAMKPKFLRFKAQVLGNEKLTPSVHLLCVSVPDEFTFAAGQFVTALIPSENGPLKRSYSIASPPNGDGQIELCVKRVEKGPGSCFLADRPVGATVDLVGPLGTFTYRGGKSVFISTGTGIAPFRSMIRSALNDGNKSTLTLLTGYRDGILFDDELSQLSRTHPNLTYRSILSRPADDYRGEQGRVQQLLEKYVADDFPGTYYLCGLRLMVDDILTKLMARGVPMSRIRFERYD